MNKINQEMEILLKVESEMYRESWIGGLRVENLLVKLLSSSKQHEIALSLKKINGKLYKHI